MTAYALSVPILSDQGETDRRYIADIQGSRRAEYEATWRRLAVQAERILHQLTPHVRLPAARPVHPSAVTGAGPDLASPRRTPR
jgi:hypothetical protein